MSDDVSDSQRETPPPGTRAELVLRCLEGGMSPPAATRFATRFPPFGFFADEQGPAPVRHRLTFADGTQWSSPPEPWADVDATTHPAADVTAASVAALGPTGTTAVAVHRDDPSSPVSAPAVPSASPPPAPVRRFAVQLYFAYRLLNIVPDRVYDDEYADAPLLFVTGLSTLRVTAGQEHGIADVTVEVSGQDPGLDLSGWELVDVARLPPLPGNPQRWLQGGFDGDPVLVWDEPGPVMVRVGSRLRGPEGGELAEADPDTEPRHEEYVFQLWPAVRREGELAGTAPLPTL